MENSDNSEEDLDTSKYRDIFEARQKYQICLHENFGIFSYIPIVPLLQKGPQCGLVALTMILQSIFHQKIEVETVFEKAKCSGYTLNGEMFSSNDFAELITTNFLRSDQVFVHKGKINDAECLEHLKSNGVILVPYDADCNHSPCMKNGHKAHWCILTGLVHCNNILYVTARHGKSKHLAIWEIEQLSLSNSQLEEFSPDRNVTGVPYIIPIGGLSGPNGLKNTCILIRSFNH